MAEGFRRPGKADYQPVKQTEIRGTFREPIEASGDGDLIGSRAEALINEYDKTITFFKFIEGLLDDQMKDVVVEINPQEQPEVWQAMERLFSNPSPKISYKTYVQVLAAIEEADQLESTVGDPFAEESEFIDQFVKNATDKITALEEDTPEMVIEGEDPAPTEPTETNTITWPQVE